MTPRWAEHRTQKWHAWLPGASASVCGFVDGTPEGPTLPRPEGHACQHCRARLRKGVRIPAPRHQEGPRCACPGCRRRRAREAEEYVPSIPSRVARIACQCVREWEGARECVDPAEARLGGLLLAWEITGGSVEARDVEDAARGLFAAWREAVEAYELFDGSHPHAEGRKP